MKKIVCFLLSALLPLQCYAQEKSVLQGVIAEMTKKYLEESAKSLVIKEMESYASRQLGLELSGKVGTILTVVNLIDGVLQYEKSESESQRYQALSQSFAAGVSLAAPPVGALVGLAVMAQGMMAMLVSKASSLKLAKLIKEISDINKLSAEFAAQEAASENKVFENLVASSLALETLIRVNSDLIKSQCAFDIQDPSLRHACFKSVLLQRTLLKLYISSMIKIATFNGRFIQIMAGLSKDKVQEILTTIADADDHLQKTETKINEAIQLYSEMAGRSVRHQTLAKYQAARCERMLIFETDQILRLQLKLTQSSSHDGMEEYLLEERLLFLEDLIINVCAQSFKNLSPDVQSVIKSLKIPIKVTPNILE